MLQDQLQTIKRNPMLIVAGAALIVITASLGIIRGGEPDAFGTSNSTVVSNPRPSLTQPEMAEAVQFQALVGGYLSSAPSGSTSAVTTPGGDEVGESSLERASDKVSLTLKACCAVPGNAYTAWWLIGDVTKSMASVRTEQAAGFVAEGDEIVLDAEIELSNPLEGIRLVVLDHGPDTGDPLQVTTSGGGCQSDPCPVVLSTSHPGLD